MRCGGDTVAMFALHLEDIEEEIKEFQNSSLNCESQKSKPQHFNISIIFFLHA